MPRDNLKSSVIDDATLEAISALTDRNRLQIMFFLGEDGPMSVSEIASRFRITRPGVSHHLKILKTCKLVTKQKVGKEVFYSVQMDHLVQLLRSMADVLERCCRPPQLIQLD